MAGGNNVRLIDHGQLIDQNADLVSKQGGIMAKQLDLRVIKTRKALTTSLYDLMCKKAFGDITVTEICDNALVRKATFYKHFGDKTELLLYMIQELQITAYKNNEIGYDPAKPESYYSGIFAYFINFIDKNAVFIKSVINGDSVFLVRSILEEEVKEEVDRRLRSEPLEEVRKVHGMLSSIYAGAMVSCGIWWASQNERVKKEEVIDTFSMYIERLWGEKALANFQ